MLFEIDVGSQLVCGRHARRVFGMEVGMDQGWRRRNEAKEDLRSVCGFSNIPTVFHLPGQMKFCFLAANLLCFLALVGFSSVGLAVYRTHAVSVAVEIVKMNTDPNIDRAKLEKVVLTTGNAPFYYRVLTNLALFGGTMNVIAIVALLWPRKPTPIK